MQPPIRFHDAQIEMAHGAGGKATRRLIEGLIAPVLGGPLLDSLGDAAFLELGGARLAVTADSFVVRPLRFPGGSIGDLAVNGTVNDLAVAGAKPVALLVTLILEAGLSTEALEIELRAVAAAARQAGVSVVGGDTKVVEHGEADGMYITTAGIGIADSRVQCSAASVRPGDRIMLSGPIGDHGITILLARGELDLEADLCSDTRSVYPMIERLVERVGVASAGCAIQLEAASRARSMSSPRIRGWGSSCRRTAFPCARRCVAPASCSASSRCTSRTRASSSRCSRRSMPTRRSTPYAPSAAARALS